MMKSDQGKRQKRNEKRSVEPPQPMELFIPAGPGPSKDFGKKRKINRAEAKERTRKRYEQLPEVQKKKLEE